MLPSTTDNGARLAAILPTGLAALAQFDGGSASHFWPGPDVPQSLPSLRSFVMIVVDGLGHGNLRARKGHAPVLSGLGGRRIETVIPSTTGAALTTLTTGELPGQHGLVGYRIMHPELGLRTTLSEWDGIPDVRGWQRSTPLFEEAGVAGVRAIAIGRPAHADGGLTRAILSGAEYHAGQRIKDRFAVASRLLRGSDRLLVYLYVDELDRAAHTFGWQSAEWVRRLEQFDAALGDFLRALPSQVGVAVTADHGIVDVPQSGQLMLDRDPDLLRGVAQVGGEPRMRGLYLNSGVDPDEVASRVAVAEGQRAWVATREQAIAAGWYGEVHPSVAPRLGDVLIAARKDVAYTLSTDDPKALAMVGQHGSLSEIERGVPLLLAGALAGTGFAAAVAAAASQRLGSSEAGSS